MCHHPAKREPLASPVPGDIKRRGGRYKCPRMIAFRVPNGEGFGHVDRPGFRGMLLPSPYQASRSGAYPHRRARTVTGYGQMPDDAQQGPVGGRYRPGRRIRRAPYSGSASVHSEWHKTGGPTALAMRSHRDFDRCGLSPPRVCRSPHQGCAPSSVHGRRDNSEGGLEVRASGSDYTTVYGRIMSLSSCSTMWQW